MKILPFCFKSITTILIGSLSFSLAGCASYSGGGEASGWANAEREVLIQGAVMVPLAIVMLPITLPYTLVKEGLKNDNNQFNEQKRDLNIHYVEVNFLSLNQDEYSMPTLYYNRVTQQYRAWIPVYESEFKDKDKANDLKQKYSTVFSNMALTIPSEDNWIAYQYKKDTWLILDQGCQSQGIYSHKTFNQNINTTEHKNDEILNIELLCKKHS